MLQQGPGQHPRGHPHPLPSSLPPPPQGTAESFLSQVLQPPEPRAVESAVAVLREVGALTEEGEALTPLGECGRPWLAWQLVPGSRCQAAGPCPLY